MLFSVIVPVYNRPQELGELLESLASTTFQEPFEVVIVEDGSTIPSDSVVSLYKSRLEISYLVKTNSGPGDSRNYGMRHAKGDYFLIFDSDCIIPAPYLSTVATCLSNQFVDCFGGPDSALDSFSDVQKAINFAMTSFMTTGGIRGGSEKLGKFQPRSFNMGISKNAFIASGGFGNIHPGEDPDLSLRLWKLGYQTKLFPDAFVYHKRRIDWNKFFTQVNKFGKARPILNKWHKGSGKLTYFFPTVFLMGAVISILLAVLMGEMIGVMVYSTYFVLLFAFSWFQNRSLAVAYNSIIATAMQFYGYGMGFLTSFVLIHIFNKKPEDAFPELFFTKS